jgi:hypothetical protein
LAQVLDLPLEPLPTDRHGVNYSDLLLEASSIIGIDDVPAHEEVDCFVDGFRQRITRIQ